MKKQLIDLMKADAIAGREQEVRRVIIDYLTPFDIKLERDGYGNQYASLTNGSQKPKLMIIAHMDEVGFMVKHITADGFIYTQPFGGWNSQVVLGQRVTVTSRQKGSKYRGVFGTTAKKGQNPQEPVTLGEMYVDIGAKNQSEVEALGIQVGDMITPSGEIEELPNNLILGKALDDRSGCVILLEVLNRLSKEAHLNVEVVGVFSAQEEVGTRGSFVAAAKINPYEALILDVATAKDTPGADQYQNRCLGHGPGIVWFDKTAVSDVKLSDRVIAIAKKEGIPFQHDVFAGGGTDAGSVQLAGGGVPTVGLSLGVRYCHSGSSIASLVDMEASVNLIVAYVKSINR
ncbi:M42 family metallopeptidase [uncultured Vagococcus sp.]|uniref:M42 family metallopeptidase n=1 Tax=uncultured Vagococcus sp. TaxID=189676 RepID=UPI0028D12524|nr:M42 family metallopeptidase [uncultured Vagococcus sp.]